MLQQVNLLQLPVGQHARICAVGSQHSEFLEMLRKKDLGIGTDIKITQRYNFDNSIEVAINGEAPQNISEQLAKQLFVKII